MLMSTAASILRRTSSITTNCTTKDIVDACAYLEAHPGTEEEALADLASSHSPAAAETALLIETAIAMGA